MGLEIKSCLMLNYIKLYDVKLYLYFEICAQNKMRYRYRYDHDQFDESHKPYPHLL